MGIHILIDRYAVCVIGTKAIEQQAHCWHAVALDVQPGVLPRFELPKAATFQSRVRIEKPTHAIIVDPARLPHGHATHSWGRDYDVAT